MFYFSRPVIICSAEHACVKIASQTEEKKKVPFLKQLMQVHVLTVSGDTAL